MCSSSVLVLILLLIRRTVSELIKSNDVSVTLSGGPCVNNHSVSFFNKLQRPPSSAYGSSPTITAPCFPLCTRTRTHAETHTCPPTVHCPLHLLCSVPAVQGDLQKCTVYAHPFIDNLISIYVLIIIGDKVLLLEVNFRNTVSLRKQNTLERFWPVV